MPAVWLHGNAPAREGGVLERLADDLKRVFVSPESQSVKNADKLGLILLKPSRIGFDAIERHSAGRNMLTLWQIDKANLDVLPSVKEGDSYS